MDDRGTEGRIIKRGVLRQKQCGGIKSEGMTWKHVIVPFRHLSAHVNQNASM